MTVAVDALTGARGWVAVFGHRTRGLASGAAIAVSPDGSQVFVVGGIYRDRYMDDYLTIAYDATDGGRLWWRHEGIGSSDDGSGLVVTPDGSEIVVTGTMGSQMGELKFGTVAYSVG